MSRAGAGCRLCGVMLRRLFGLVSWTGWGRMRCLGAKESSFAVAVVVFVSDGGDWDLAEDGRMDGRLRRLGDRLGEWGREVGGGRWLSSDF